MKRWGVLCALIASGGISFTLAAQQQPAGPRTASIEKVRDNVYLLSGTDRGVRLVMTAFVMSSGVAVVDTGYPGWGQAWLAALKSVTDKPVTVVLSTHTHSDHTGSNGEFGDNIQFVAHENTRVNLARPTCSATGGCAEFQGGKAKYLPATTFKDRLTLFRDADQIDLYYAGRAHTNGDAVIVFPAVRVAAVGDLFAWRGVPRVMPEDGGSVLEFPATLAKAQSSIANVDAVTSGHSRVMQWSEWVEYKDFVSEFVKQIRAAKAAGRTVDEAVAGLKMPDPFKLCDPRSTATTELQAGGESDCRYRSDQARADAQILYAELGAAR